MKSILLSIMVLFSTTQVNTTNACEVQQNELNENQAYMYFIEKSEMGYLFLEPTHEENLVFIPFDESDKFNIIDSDLFKGKKYKATFDDAFKWELINVVEVNY